jgi:ribonuclease D
LKWKIIRLPWAWDRVGAIEAELEASLEPSKTAALAVTIEGHGDSAHLVVVAASSSAAKPRHHTEWRKSLAPGDGDHFDRLCEWRRGVARLERRPAYSVLTNRALAGLACLRPRSDEELLAVPGVGPRTVERYAPPLLEITSADVSLHGGVLHDTPLAIDAAKDDEGVTARSGPVRVSEDPSRGDGQAIRGRRAGLQDLEL